MESSKSKNEIFCYLRKKWVEKTPEELVRQTLIKKMVEELSYPLGFIAIEKELSQLPSLKGEPISLPKRRIDLIVFSKNSKNTPLFPLLMVECKAVPITPKVARQIVGYNAFVKAPFLAIANQFQILTGYFDEKENQFQFKEGLPTFDLLHERALP